MSNGIFVAMTGATARSRQLEAVADNLANASTPGFKGTLPVFETVMTGSDGSLSSVGAVQSGVDARPGPAVETRASLDVLPDGGLYLGVLLPSGQTGYTRAGRLQSDGAGVLRAGAHPVLGASGEIIQLPPGKAPVIRSDGRVQVDGATLDELALFQVNGTMRRGESNVLLPDAGGAAERVRGAVRIGVIEMSNTSALDATVQLVSVQRHFDFAMQAIQTYRKLDSTAVDIGRVR